MNFNPDLLGLVLVYSYVIIVLIISEKLLNDKPFLSRKFTHIMVGGILFLLPLFTSREVMALLVAFPFVIATFLMSEYSPIKISNKISSSGHGLGLFYYAISWTVLAYVFFDQPYVIGIGIAAMSFGDGFAALIGKKFGKHEYNLFGDKKTIEGSLTMFLVLITSIWIVLNYYIVFIGYDPSISNIWLILIPAFVATIAEGITPKGVDNITACFSAVAVYLILLL
jgi:dolichol kinase